LLWEWRRLVLIARLPPYGRRLYSLGFRKVS
jgi:hypothetical protein